MNHQYSQEELDELKKLRSEYIEFVRLQLNDRAFQLFADVNDIIGHVLNRTSVSTVEGMTSHDINQAQYYACRGVYEFAKKSCELIGEIVS